MNARSVWRGTAPAAAWPKLERDLQADVVVVGGGITGATLARRLAAEGSSVVLLEAGRVGGTTTAGSTGNLYATLTEGLQPIEEKWGEDVARSVVDSRLEAIEAIEREIDALHIDAGLVRCPLYRYASTATTFDGTPTQETIEREFIATQQGGLQARLENALPPGLPAPHGPVLVVDGQAQFHPLAYVQALTARAASDGCRVFEESAAIAIDADKGEVRTARAAIAAREIVLATHSPSGFHKVQVGLLPSREYGIAFPVPRDALPPGIYWDIGQEPLSARTLDAGDEHRLVCVGRPWPSGQHDAGEALASLESLAKRSFGARAIEFAWSAQNFRSPDLLPYVGRDGSDALIATGYGTDGLVFGTLAAMILADTVLGRENRWNALYRGDRLTPVKSAGSVLGETAKVVKAAVKDYVTDRQAAELRQLAPRQGAIVEIDDERIAAYRDAHGEIFAVSPRCTHMGCIVHWNEVETSWDCPCHGSRFAIDGSVLEGPALAPLERRRLRDGE